jgi:TPR repeat protein
MASPDPGIRGRAAALRLAAAAIAAAIAAAAPVAGRAEFFRLEGFDACIDHPEAPACRERLTPRDADRPAGGAASPEPAPPEPSAGVRKPEAAAAARPDTPPRAQRAKAKTAEKAAAAADHTATAAAGGGGLDAAIARVRTGKVGEKDRALLEEHAAAKNPKAVEVLAWCYLNGSGCPADPIRAYWLYGQATDLGVPNARQNQVLIFEQRMTSEQRQTVLVEENVRRREGGGQR